MMHRQPVSLHLLHGRHHNYTTYLVVITIHLYMGMKALIIAAVTFRNVVCVASCCHEYALLWSAAN